MLSIKHTHTYIYNQSPHQTVNHPVFSSRQPLFTSVSKHLIPSINYSNYSGYNNFTLLLLSFSSQYLMFQLIFPLTPDFIQNFPKFLSSLFSACLTTFTISNEQLTIQKFLVSTVLLGTSKECK